MKAANDQNNALTERMELRMSRATKQAIEQRAETLGMSTSVYLRTIGEHGEIIINESSQELSYLIVEINRIGVNLNQGIAKLNETGRVTALLMEAHDELRLFLSKILDRWAT